MKTQMALWILSKTSMVFFIIALFAIVVAGTDLWKKSFCSSQADVLASQITDLANQIINSPLEDEKRIFALEPALSVGSETLQKYNIYITFIPDHVAASDILNHPGYINYDGRINVKVSTEGGCSASRTLSFTDYVTIPKTVSNPTDEEQNQNGFYTITDSDKLLFDENILSNTQIAPYLKKIKVSPSFTSLEQSQYRSNYLIFIKCTNKNINAIPLGSKFFFLHNCAEATPNDCLKLDTDTEIYTDLQTGVPGIKVKDVCQQNPNANPSEPE